MTSLTMGVPADPDWIDRFGERLVGLCPTMSAITAAALGLEAHRHEPDGCPETVAERFHANHFEPAARDTCADSPSSR